MPFAPADPAALPAAPTWQLVLVLLPALACVGGALLAGGTPARAWRVARGAASLALAGALAGALVAAAGALLPVGGAAQGWGLRADGMGAVMALLVAFVGWVIVRYCGVYLAGEPGQVHHARALLATLAAVALVVASNHLLLLAATWTATSLALHRLLTFYDDRAPARRAAHKKFVVGRVADLAMLAACALLHAAFGTLRLDEMAAAAAAAGGLPAAAQAGVPLVALAAVLKCAQLPVHGWLIQVMEAPTPVSALLHAGVVNLGGFVLIRLAPLLAETPAALGLLAAAGGFTALVAALVMGTRISVKVALAWSTVAQMGFMLLQCGLGLWATALLHLVAHSLYKAHAFLSAGATVRQAQRQQLAPPLPAPGAGTLLAGALLALAAAGAAGALVAEAAAIAGLAAPTGAAHWVMAGVLVLALVPMTRPLPPVGGTAAPGAALTTLKAPARPAAAAFGVALAWFALHALLAPWVAPGAVAALPAWVPVAVALGFGALFVLQAVLQAAPAGRLARALHPWCYGGLFLDERFARLLFRLWPPPSARAAPRHAARPGA